MLALLPSIRNALGSARETLLEGSRLCLQANLCKYYPKSQLSLGTWCRLPCVYVNGYGEETVNVVFRGVGHKNYVWLKGTPSLHDYGDNGRC